MFSSENHIVTSIKTCVRVLHECNTIQDQEDDEKFIFNKINEHSVKVKVADAASRVVFELQEISYCFTRKKLTSKDKQQLSELIIFEQIHIA